MMNDDDQKKTTTTYNKKIDMGKLEDGKPKKKRKKISLLSKIKPGDRVASKQKKKLKDVL